jgi:hypothetical protein
VEVCALNVAVYVDGGFMMVKIHVVVVWFRIPCSLIGFSELLVRMLQDSSSVCDRVCSGGAFSDICVRACARAFFLVFCLFEMFFLQ